MIDSRVIRSLSIKVAESALPASHKVVTPLARQKRSVSPAISWAFFVMAPCGEPRELSGRGTAL